MVILVHWVQMAPRDNEDPKAALGHVVCPDLKEMRD